MLLQFCIFSFGCSVDGNVEICVFPEGKEVLVCSAGFDGVALQRIGSSNSEMRQHGGLARSYQPAVVQDFLKFSSGGGTLLQGQISFAPNIRGIKTTSERRRGL